MNREYVTTRFALKGVMIPKSDEKPPFKTWAEIEQVISRGGITPQEEWELWGSLFLSRDEIDEALLMAKEKALHPFVRPMIFFTAHTGARLSEVIRSHPDDFDFHMDKVRIREKKRSRKKGLTYRYVPLSDPLREVMRQWFGVHPGGPFTIATEDGEGLTAEMARLHFNQVFMGTKWEKLRGFHVLRHSFASNLAGGGVDQRLIDEWLGHQTDEMRRRYRHLFPDKQREAIDSVFGATSDDFDDVATIKLHV